MITSVSVRSQLTYVLRTSISLLPSLDVTIMGRFAFASSYCPGSGDDRIFIAEVLTPIWGEWDLADEKKPLVRRLFFFEAYTFVASDMRARVDRTDADPPKRMPKAELESRLDHIKGREASLRVKDESEPGPTMINKFGQMADDGIL